MKAYYDAPVKPKSFEEGQKVLLYDPCKKRGQSFKWQILWKGPFVIKKRLNASNYVVQRVAGRKSFVMHTDRLCALSDDHSVDRATVNNLLPQTSDRPSLPDRHETDVA